MSQGQRHLLKPAVSGLPSVVTATIEAVHADGRTGDAIAARAGVSWLTIAKWARGYCSPNVASLEAVLNTVGYRLVVEKIND